MALSNVATLTCADPTAPGEALVIVDAGPEVVRLCLSRRDDGDADAVLGLSDARRVLAALEAAVARASGAPASAAMPTVDRRDSDQ